MIINAKLVDIWDNVSQDVRDAFTDSVELNGNPFYHRWRIESPDKWDRHEQVARKTIVNAWLKNQGLTENDIIIITGGW